MNATDREASKKWCPMVRASQGENDNNASNTGTKDEFRNPDYARCIGSQCMMWVWDFEKDERCNKVPVTRPTSEEWVCEDCNGTGRITEPRFGGIAEVECSECEGAGKGRVYAPVGHCGLIKQGGGEG